MSDQLTLNEAIASIAAAYAGRPDVGPDDVVALVARLRREFSAPTTDQAQPEAAPVATAVPEVSADRPEPALPLEAAVTQDRVFCLCCGKGFKMLKRHLGAEHALTEAQYRAMFGLSEDVPLVAPSYSSRKADYAKKVGFGRYDRARASAETPEDETTA